MKLANSFQIGRRAAWVLGLALVFSQQAVQACPGCKQATEGRDAVPLNGASIGFGLSIFFMIFMIVALLGGLGFMMYRSCRALAARERAMLAEEGLESGIVGSLQPRPA